MRMCSRLVAAAWCALALGLTTAAAAQNLVPDPAFTQGVSAWTPDAVTGNFTMLFEPNISKRPGSGSALLSFTGPASGAFSVCVPVTEGISYDWGWSAFFPDAARVIGLNEFVDIHAGPACSGASIGGFVLPILPGSLNTWVGPTSRVFTPPGARSARVGFAAMGVGGAQPFGYFDDVFFGVTGTVPPIDLPPSIPSLSHSGAAALGLLLAALTLRSLKG